MARYHLKESHLRTRPSSRAERCMRHSSLIRLTSCTSLADSTERRQGNMTQTGNLGNGPESANRQRFETVSCVQSNLVRTIVLIMPICFRQSMPAAISSISHYKAINYMPNNQATTNANRQKRTSPLAFFPGRVRVGHHIQPFIKSKDET